jgi:hypothetical protein
MILLLVSCTTQGYETIEIIWKESQSNQIVVRGMWVRVSSDQILTSAHVVRDDRLVYEIWGMFTGYPSVRYEVSSRDTAGDRATLSQVQDVKIQTQNPRLQRVQKWDPIYTEVSRSGSIVRIVGRVVDPSGSILGYDTLWRVVTLSGIVLTDIDLQPGDSGAPIYTTLWDLIDVVHVR